ncbi:MAG: hypothetical protein ACOZBH_04545 [Patescibacteria group bacterium]
MESSILKILVEGGSICVMIVVLVYFRYKDGLVHEERMAYNKTINNHLDHQTAADIQRAQADKELAMAITELKDAVQGCPTNYKHK